MIPSPWWRTTQARGCWVLLPLIMGVPGAPLGPGCRVSRPAACQTFFLLLHRGDCYREGGHHLPPCGGGGVGGAWVSTCAAAQLAWFLRGGGGVRQTNSSEGPPWLTHTQSVCLLARWQIPVVCGASAATWYPLLRLGLAHGPAVCDGG